MSAERPGANERGRVISLRPRLPKAGNDNRRPPPLGTTPPGQPAIDDLTRYERTTEGDDYHHRMLVNGLALIVCIFLVLAGVWLANKMAEVRKNQDCVLSGRRGCTPVDVPVRSRW